MGCGKSKLDVVPGNTISSKRSNASKRSSKREPAVESKNTAAENNVGAVEENIFVEAEGESQIVYKECENAGETKVVQEQETEESKNAATTKLLEHQDQIQNEILEENAADESVADSKRDGLKQEMETEISHVGDVAAVEEPQEQPESLVSRDSPQHFFSSRREEDAVAVAADDAKSENVSATVDAVVVAADDAKSENVPPTVDDVVVAADDAKSENVSPTVDAVVVAAGDAKSDYVSPTDLSGKDGLFQDQKARLYDDAVALADSKEKVVEEKKQESGEGKPVIEKVEDSVKEGKAEAGVEPEAATQTEEKKIVQ